MHKYNEKEAILQKWKKILLNLRDNSKNKKALLNIINSDKKVEIRLFEFNKKRVSILQEEKNSEESLSFFGWIWSIIVSLFCFCWPQISAPSDLQTQLLAEISPESVSRISERTTDSGNFTLLNDADFEEALFINPAKAFADIRARINFLPEIRGKINNIIERLDAIKYLLTADTYQKMLTKLYESFPLETLCYQYKNYKSDQEKFIGPEEFLELELMSRALMDLFILPLDTDPMNLRCFAIQELLLVLSLSHLKRPPLIVILEDAIKNKTKLSELFKTLGPGYEQAKSQILNLVPGSIEHLKDSTLILNKVIELQNYRREKNFIYQPIFLNFARLACQELLSNYHQFPQQHNNIVLHQTIEFLSTAILETWSEAMEERKKIEDLMVERKHIKETNFSMSECCAILSIFSHTQASKFNYQNAVYYANQIIMASLAGAKAIINKAEEFNNLKHHEQAWVISVIKRLESMNSNMTEQDFAEKAERFSLLKPKELNWMFKVIENIQPNGIQLAEKIKLKMAKSEKTIEPVITKKQTWSTARNSNRFSGNPKIQILPETLKSVNQPHF